MKMRFLFSLAAIIGIGLGVFAHSDNAFAADSEFNLQVSPSPLVLTLKPGETTGYDLKIRNAGTQAESLRIDPRSFSIDNASGEVKLDDTKKPPEIGDWVSFSSPTLMVQPGAAFTEKVNFAIPQGAGFSYSFALMITRQNDAPTTTDSGRKLKGKVAVFALINIDKPGAVRKLNVVEFSTDQSTYEYLPAKLNVKFQNAGNTIVRPAGNIFVQRKGDDTTPISTLAVNPGEGYILPGSVRTLSAEWNDGFQVVRESTDAAGNTQKNVEWNWANLSRIRIGKYTAKLVAIYNDGHRDVPVMGEVTFWVFPWKLLLGVLVIVVILGFGIWSVVGKLFGASRKMKRRVSTKKPRA